MFFPPELIGRQVNVLEVYPDRVVIECEGILYEIFQDSTKSYVKR